MLLGYGSENNEQILFLFFIKSQMQKKKIFFSSLFRFQATHKHAFFASPTHFLVQEHELNELKAGVVCTYFMKSVENITKNGNSRANHFQQD